MDGALILPLHRRHRHRQRHRLRHRQHSLQEHSLAQPSMQLMPSLPYLPSLESLPPLPFLPFLLVLSLCWSVTTGAQVTASPMFEGYTAEERVVCSSITLTGTITDDSLAALRNCTDVEGSVKVLLGEREEWEGVALMPRLRQVLDSVVLYHVSGLPSVGAAFPALRVIRGRRGVGGAGGPVFVLQSNWGLTELSLPGLSFASQHSTVLVRHNWQLCLPALPPWTKVQGYIGENGVYCEYDSSGCHYGDVSCRRSVDNPCKSTCSNGCAANIPNTKPMEGRRVRHPNGECCHEECLGGCHAAQDSSSCVACKNYVHLGDCVKDCPDPYLSYLNYRCVSSAQCREMEGHVLKGTTESSSSQCLQHYLEWGTEESEEGVCGNIVLEGSDTSQPSLPPHTCRVVQGSIVLRGPVNGTVVSQLSRLLSHDLVVRDFVLVSDTQLLSLDFIFSRLTRVQGRRLYGDGGGGGCVICIFDNTKLQELISPDNDDQVTTSGDTSSSSAAVRRDKKIKKALLLDAGTALLRGNSALCPQATAAVLPPLNINLTDQTNFEVYSRKHNELNDVNVPCNLSLLEVTHIAASPTSLHISWHGPYEGPNKSVLQGYKVHYRTAALEERVHMFRGRDACSDWRLWRQSETMDQNTSLVMTELQAGTRYAIYIEAVVLPAFVLGTYDNMHGSRSGIVYCQTQPTVPSQPRHVRVQNKSGPSRSNDIKNVNDSVVRVSWSPPAHPGGRLQGYQVLLCPETRLQQLQHTLLQHRTVCSVDDLAEFNKEKDRISESYLHTDFPGHVASGTTPTARTSTETAPSGSNSAHDDSHLWCNAESCTSREKEWMKMRQRQDSHRVEMRINADSFRPFLRNNNISATKVSGAFYNTNSNNAANAVSSEHRRKRQPQQPPTANVGETLASGETSASTATAATPATTKEGTRRPGAVCGTPVDWDLMTPVRDMAGPIYAASCEVRYVPHHSGSHSYNTTFTGLPYFTPFTVSVRACQANLTKDFVTYALCSSWNNITNTTSRHPDRDRVSGVRVKEIPEEKMREKKSDYINTGSDSNFTTKHVDYSYISDSRPTPVGNATVHTDEGQQHHHQLSKASPDGSKHNVNVTKSANDDHSGGISYNNIPSNFSDEIPAVEVSWSPPPYPNGGRVLSYVVEVPGVVHLCVSGTEAVTSNNRVILSGVPISRRSDVTVAVFSLAGRGPLIKATFELDDVTVLHDPVLLIVVLLCCVFVLVVIVLSVVLLAKRDEFVFLDDGDRLSNPCYAHVAIQDEFILSPESVLIIPDKSGGNLGAGRFGSVSVGWILKPKTGHDMGKRSKKIASKLLRKSSETGDHGKSVECSDEENSDEKDCKSDIDYCNSNYNVNDQMASTSAKTTAVLQNGNFGIRRKKTKNFHDNESCDKEFCLHKQNASSNSYSNDIVSTGIEADRQSEVTSSCVCDHFYSRNNFARAINSNDNVDNTGSVSAYAQTRAVAEALLRQRPDGRRWRLHKQVAVKTLVSDIADETPEEKEIRKNKFNREAGIMQHLLGSAFVVRFEGAVMQEPRLILMECVEGGNLWDFITNPRNVITEQHIYNFIIQIADGMAYIASKRIIHIDLASRNCLVKRGRIIKIADFGLSRKLPSERYYYHYLLGNEKTGL